jgi:hypothetical protein
MKRLVIVGMLLFIYGCQTPMKIFISSEEIPIKIEKTGCFVSKSDYTKLVNGESVNYYNGRLGKFYIPSNLIDIIDNKVTLKRAE